MENFEIHNRTIYCKTLDKLLSLLDSYIYDINPLYEGIKVSRVKHTVLLTDDNVTDFWKYTLTYDRGLKLTHKTYKGKTKLLKNPVTVKKDDKIISTDINEIIKIILGDNATIEDTN